MMMNSPFPERFIGVEPWSFPSPDQSHVFGEGNDQVYKRTNPGARRSPTAVPPLCQHQESPPHSRPKNPRSFWPGAGIESSRSLPQVRMIVGSGDENVATSASRFSEHAQSICFVFSANHNLVPKGPFCHALEKFGPLARSKDIPVLNGFVNTIDWDQNRSDLSDLTLSMRRMTGSLWIADFRCWTWPEVAIPVASQEDRRLWERDWANQRFARFDGKSVNPILDPGLRKREELLGRECEVPALPRMPRKSDPTRGRGHSRP